MNKTLKRIIYTIAFLLLGSIAISQGPPPPGGGPGPGDPPVGAAPLSDGILTLLTFAATYGAFKVYYSKKS